MEGIGYIFYRGYAEGFRPHPISKASEEAIKRYWVKKRQSEGSQEE
jgi:hypothetical protein